MEIHPSLWTYLLSDQFHFDAYKWDHVVAAGVTFLLLTLMALAVKAGRKMVPGTLQQINEVVIEGLVGMLEENMGKEGRKYLPLIGTLACFIFVSNLLGMIPAFSAATGNFNTTVACALIVFVYYNFEGFREHGIGYLKHFAGPMPLIAPLMFPIEIISHLARPFSLAIRLFGNISGEHAVAGAFYSMVAILLPVPLMAFGLFAAFLQTFVFVLLTIIYIAGSIAHDH